MTLAQMQQRRDSAAHWTSVNPVLAAGELGFETDTGRTKIGDGVSVWSALGYEGANSYVAARNLQGASATQLFTIGPRSQVTTLPAVSVRPAGANLVCALDVMPNGSATQNPTEGYAWIDVCSTDIADNLNNTTVAHVGITSTAAVFGSRGYGITAPPVSFEVGAGNSVASLDSSGTLNVHGSVVAPFMRAAVGQPYIDLRSSGVIRNTANSASDTPLVSRGVANQSGDSFRIEDENGNAQIRVTGASSAQYGDFVIGRAQLPVAATHGFIHLPSIAGTPTSTSPPTYAGTQPVVIDPANNKIWMFNGTAWKSVTLT